MAELYKFTDGLQIVGFSPQLFSEDWGGVTYTAVPISRSSITLAGNLIKSQVTFSFPSDSDFAKQFVFNLPGEPWTVSVYEDKVLLWLGRVITATISGAKISLVADSADRKQARNPSGARVALHCWKTLYSPSCGAVQSLHKETITVEINGLIVTLPASQPLNKFAGGIINKDGESRRITQNSDLTLELATPFSEAASATGDADLYPGCNLTSTNCGEFLTIENGVQVSNIVNFGGFEHIPMSNPMERSGLL